MYWLEFNGWIEDEVLENIPIKEEGLTLEEAIDNAKEIIKQSRVPFCTCAIKYESVAEGEEVRGWVNYNCALNTEPQWKEAP